MGGLGDGVPSVLDHLDLDALPGLPDALQRPRRRRHHYVQVLLNFSSSLFLASLDLSDSQVCKAHVRALLGTASQFCEEVVLRSRTGASKPFQP